MTGQSPNEQACPLCGGTGKAYDPGMQFTYELGPIVVPASGTMKGQSVQILQGRLDLPGFRWEELTGSSTSPLFTFKLYRGRDQKPFSNQEIFAPNILGTGQNPFPLLTPFEFLFGELILADFTDLSGAQNTIKLDFHGVQLEQPQ